MKKLIVLSIAILTTLSCCKKEEIKPEDYTFYCKVDGMEWKRTGQNYFCPGCSPLESDYYASEKPWNPKGLFEILAHRDIESKGIRQYIYIVTKILQEGSNISNLRKRSIYTDYNSDCGRYQRYNLDTNYHNSFFIKSIDTIHKTIKGSFNLRLISDDCPEIDTIKIFDGHFDLNPIWHP